MQGLNDILNLVGRFHLVLLHLPIGFLVLLAGLELISLRKSAREATTANRYILLFTVPATIASAVCGWLLAEGGGYDRQLLFLHRWTGVAVAVATCALWWAHASGKPGLYRAMIGATLPLTIVAGHFGGSLTHGKGFLTRVTSKPTRASTEGDPGGYAAVAPIFQEYCNACHGLEKQKGGLRTDSLESLLAGGDSGPGIVGGDPDASRIIQRVELPMDDEDHMPPDGKPQPNREAVQRVRDWLSTVDLASP